MSLHITDIKSKHSNQAKLISTYENHLEKITNNNKRSTKFDTAGEKKWRVTQKDIWLIQIKSIYLHLHEILCSLLKKTSSYDQHSADHIKWPLLK